MGVVFDILLGTKGTVNMVLSSPLGFPLEKRVFSPSTDDAK